MAAEKISIEKFLELAELYPVLDVRSPGEYQRAHIPGAISFPLFSDEERKVVGTAYKQESREKAIKIGLDYFGARMRRMVEEAEVVVSRESLVVSQQPEVVVSRESSVDSRERSGDETGLMTNDLRLTTDRHSNKTLIVHCWRGGMRSAAVAWLLDLYGFKVYTLVGGYKKYRSWVLETYSKNYSFKIVGGYTGSGKTYVMKQLKKEGENVVDLEDLAKHKGSAFGNIGMPAQPSQEMFENLLSRELHLIHKLNNQPPNSSSSVLTNDLRQTTSDHSSRLLTPDYRLMTNDYIIWLEDESQRIGDVNLPHSLWKTMRESPVYFLDIPFEERLKHIVVEYGGLDREKVAGAIERIQKRLGGLETKTALQQLKEGDIEGCFRILLKYYDKWYIKGLNNREDLKSLLNKIDCELVDAEINTKRLLNYK